MFDRLRDKVGKRRESKINIEHFATPGLLLPLLGERAGVRAGKKTSFTCSNRIRVTPALLEGSLSVVFWLAAALSGGAAVFQEAFASEPSAHGWGTFGDASLFHWNATNQNVEVTWDSSRTNSFFHMPLGTIVTKSDDFSFSFEVRLSDIRVGSTPGKSNEFEIAIGLLNYASATRTNAFRGSGVSPTYGVKNLIEFDYFPDAGFGETFATTVVSTNNRIFPAHNFPLAMTTGDTFRVTLTYAANNRLLRTTATRNGVPYGMPPNNTLADLSLNGAPDFRVDSFAIISYSDANQLGPTTHHGSVLAHGTVDNVEFTVPLPVSNLQLSFAETRWRAEFASRTNWIYTLHRSVDWSSWAPASAAVSGTGGTLLLTDTNAPAGNAFYRIRAERP
jgi:hypothetical protein